MTDTVNWESVLADDQQRLAIAWFNFRDADESAWLHGDTGCS